MPRCRVSASAKSSKDFARLRLHFCRAIAVISAFLTVAGLRPEEISIAKETVASYLRVDQSLKLGASNRHIEALG